MSYDIYLNDPVTKNVISLDTPHFMRGCTFATYDIRELHFNITYNYSDILYRVLPCGVRSIYGKTGLESIPILEKAINKLGDDAYDDYWVSTEGNVKRALISLLTMAKIRPDGIWSGD